MNGYEMFGRQKKADAIFAVMREAGITLAEARRANDEDWQMAANAARVNAPSAQTVAAILTMMERAEVEADDKAEAKWEESQEYGGNRCPERE